MRKNIVNIYYFDLNHLSCTDLQYLASLLSKREMSRALQFKFRRDKDRFIVSRGMLRLLLASYLNTGPEAIKFYSNSYGKPFVSTDSASDTIHFNMSHSGDYVIYAFNRFGGIGIDLELMVPDFVNLDIIDRFFSGDESAYIRTLAGNYKVEAFYSCWTRKEAFIKAVGEGLSFSLRDFSVSIKPDEPAGILEIRGDAEEASKWSVQEIRIHPGYKAAFAIKAKGFEVKIYGSEYKDVVISEGKPTMSRL